MSSIDTFNRMNESTINQRLAQLMKIKIGHISKIIFKVIETGHIDNKDAAIIAASFRV